MSRERFTKGGMFGDSVCLSFHAYRTRLSGAGRKKSEQIKGTKLLGKHIGSPFPRQRMHAENSRAVAAYNHAPEKEDANAKKLN